MADAVQDRKPEAHQGDIFIPGDVLHVGVGHEQVHRGVFDPLVQQELVPGGLDVDRIRHLMGDLPDLDAPLLAPAHHAHFGDRVEPRFH